MDNLPVEVGLDNFDEEVLAAREPVLVDFWGPSCVPCLALMPFVAELSQSCRGRLKVAKVDASHNRRLCINLKVMSLPTFLLFVGGQEVNRLTGDVKKQAIIDSVRSILVSEGGGNGSTEG
ncbi:MAG: thioredoxin [Chloroflexi bacterium]|nr:thioredoxin [Chloroflexota bacterium]